jgi:hypothetical protein
MLCHKKVFSLDEDKEDIHIYCIWSRHCNFRGFEFMSYRSGVKRTIKELASLLRLYESLQAFLKYARKTHI